MPPSQLSPSSAAREGLQSTEPEKQDIQFRDDGHVLINMSHDAITDKALGVVSAFFASFGDLPAVFACGLASVILLSSEATQKLYPWLFFYFLSVVYISLNRAIDRRLSLILDQVDLTLAQQAQDIGDFITRCSRFARKMLGLTVELQEPAEWRNTNERTHTILSLPPKSLSAPSQGPASTASGSSSVSNLSSKRIFPT
jgi:hypothetical protein